MLSGREGNAADASRLPVKLLNGNDEGLIREFRELAPIVEGTEATY
jgi:hypothetical protein